MNGDGCEEFAGCGFSHLSFPARALPVFASSSKCYNTNLLSDNCLPAHLRAGPVEVVKSEAPGWKTVF